MKVIVTSVSQTNQHQLPPNLPTNLSFILLPYSKPSLPTTSATSSFKYNDNDTSKTFSQFAARRPTTTSQPHYPSGQAILAPHHIGMRRMCESNVVKTISSCLCLRLAGGCGGRVPFLWWRIKNYLMCRIHHRQASVWRHRASGKTCLQISRWVVTPSCHKQHSMVMIIKLIY